MRRRCPAMLLQVLVQVLVLVYMLV
jgi:hypothetical protein